MNESIRESIIQWKQLFGQDEEQAYDHLLIIIKEATHTIAASFDTNEMDAIRVRLEQTIGDKRPDDLYSYNLGMANAAALMLRHSVKQKQLDRTMRTLPALEGSVVKQLERHPRATPTALSQLVGVTNRQQMSNLLRSLKAKGFVHCDEEGKHRYYSLTSQGRQFVEWQAANNEQASARNWELVVSNSKKVEFPSLFSQKPSRALRHSSDLIAASSQQLEKVEPFESTSLDNIINNVKDIKDKRYASTRIASILEPSEGGKPGVFDFNHSSLLQKA